MIFTFTEDVLQFQFIRAELSRAVSGKQELILEQKEMGLVVFAAKTFSPVGLIVSLC